MAEENEGFVPPLGRGIAHIFDRLPLVGLARDYHFDLGLTEGLHLLFEACGADNHGNLGDRHVRIACDSQGWNVKTNLEGAGQLLECGVGNCDEVRALGMGISLPAEGLVDAGKDVIPAGVGVDFIVETVDDKMMLVDVCEFLSVDWIIGKEGGIVAMVVESGLVADDQVVTTAHCFAKDIHGIEKGGGDACYRRGRVAGLERIDSVGRGRWSVAMLDAQPGVCGGEGLGGGWAR